MALDSTFLSSNTLSIIEDRRTGLRIEIRDLTCERLPRGYRVVHGGLTLSTAERIVQRMREQRHVYDPDYEKDIGCV